MHTQNTNQTTVQQINCETPPNAYKEINTTTLFAQPYNIDAAGFYFTSTDEYDEKSAGLTDSYGSPVEEFEIMFIDGSAADSQLFNAAGVNQCNFPQFLDLIDDLNDYEKAALYYLMSNNGYSMSDAMDRIEDVSLYNGNLEEAATELFDECYAYSIPENLRNYIDYEKFARDCDLGGDMTEFDFGGETYTCTNANGI